MLRKKSSKDDEKRLVRKVVVNKDVMKMSMSMTKSLLRTGFVVEDVEDEQVDA